MHQLSGARFDWKQLTSCSHLVSALTKEAVPCGCLRKTCVVSGSQLLILCSPKCWIEACFSPWAWDEAERTVGSWEGPWVHVPPRPHVWTPSFYTLPLGSYSDLYLPPPLHHLLSWSLSQIKTLVLSCSGTGSLTSPGDGKLPEGKHFL